MSKVGVEVENWRLGLGNWKLGVGNWRFGVGSLELKVQGCVIISLTQKYWK